MFQIYLRDAFEQISPKSLSKEEWEKSLWSHLFLKEKLDLSVKGCLVSGGNKQQETINKVESALPAAELESVLLTTNIDDHKELYFSTIDIPNAFVQITLKHKEDCAVMRLRVQLAEVMVKVALKIYTKYLIIKLKGDTILYVCLLNSLYGIIKTSLLYHKRVVKDLN